MAKVPTDVQGAGVKQLKPDMVGNPDALVATISGVEFQTGQYGKRTVLTFKEHADVCLRVGKQGTDTLIAKFGDETDEWLDEKVPLVKARTNVGGNASVVFQIAPASEWEELLKAAKKATRK